MNELNTCQREAVEQTSGPMLILAGAGSGKTTVLIERIAGIIQNCDTRPYNILAITFTNKAAGVLKERLISKLGSVGGDVFAATFHSACVRLLRQFADKLGFSKNFTIYDKDDQLRAVKEIYKLNNIDEKFLPYKACIGRIGRFKDSLISPKEAATAAGVSDRVAAGVYEAYQNRLKSASAFDFDDLIYYTVRLLEQNEDALNYCHNRFKYVLVDEFQDTSIAQFRLVSLLTGSHQNLCVVGDDDQSIYRFRGATIENILGFERHYPSAKVIKLEENYRSTKNILSAANSVIKNNNARKGKTLFTKSHSGDSISFYRAESEYDEAAHLGSCLGGLLNSGSRLSDCAVLYRMNAQSGPIEAYCARNGIRYKVVGGQRFFERHEIKDILSYLSVLTNPTDDLRLKRIINMPTRGIGATTIERIAGIAQAMHISYLDVIRDPSQFAPLARAAAGLHRFYELYLKLAASSATLCPSELCTAVIEDTGYKNMLLSDKDDGEWRLENLAQLVSMLADYETKYGNEATLEGFLEEVALVSDLDSYDDEADLLVMMTVHAAKGLEFDNVFIIGMEDGIFPMDTARYSEDELEEERRLCYVALTRAKKRLFISVAATRMLFGETKYNRPSRFIEEIPEELFDFPVYAEDDCNYLPSTGNSSLLTPKKQDAVMVYSVGLRVIHDVFGKGVVQKITPLSGDMIVEVLFEKAGVKKTMANYAPMRISED